MNPKKIKGEYIVRASLADMVNSYAFTGENRNKDLYASSNFRLGFTCGDIQYGSNVYFNDENRLNIKAVRLVTSGADGLRRGQNASVAGKFELSANDMADGTGNYLGFLTFTVDNYNEWQPVNIKFQPSKGSTGSMFFLLVYQNSSMFIDDYNIQDAYVGETFNVFLELLIDTAGIIDYYGRVE